VNRSVSYLNFSFLTVEKKGIKESIGIQASEEEAI